jgi:hypothetical protein
VTSPARCIGCAAPDLRDLARALDQLRAPALRDLARAPDRLRGARPA